MKKSTSSKTIKKFGYIGYPVGDMVARIKNAVRSGHKKLEVPHSKLSMNVAKVLKEEGFLSEVVKNENVIEISLAYRKKLPVLVDLKSISKPGRRVYVTAADIYKKRGASIYIITSSKGVVSSKKAVKDNVGGEVIVEAY